MDDNDVMTESPEEKAFFDSKGADTVVVEKEEPELPLQGEPAKEEPEAQERQKETVPLAVLMEERAARKELKAKLDKALSRFDQLSDMIKPKEQPAERPDPNVDPIGALKEAQERLDRFENQGKESQEEQAIGNFAKQHADAFRQVKPDFDEAYNFIRANRAQELMNTGRATMEDIGLQLRAEEKQIIKTAAQFQVSPAAFMYALAQAGGYTPKQAQQAAAEAQEPIKQPTPEEKIKMQAEGQARAANPVGKAGAAGNGKLDLKALAMLDDDEFDKATSGKNWSKMWN